ncbi:MAG TPA: DNA adenine methylase [Fimbriimonadaceae bacterium]|jgi:adenine-specific DNA-methyltransferase
MIKYLGSKRKLIGPIAEVAAAFPEAETAIDLFSGTSRVGHALKKHGLRVFSNDVNAYAHKLATCYVQANVEDVKTDVEQLITEFNSLPGHSGYFTETFCIQSRYFQPHNGEKIDAIREAICQKSLNPELEAVLIVSLMEAADRVDSTTGVQMAYLKQWATRSFNNLELRMPALLPGVKGGPCAAYRGDVFEALSHLSADIAYIDPPYNQHSYLGNYHIWESLTLWDQPEVYGIACKRVDCRQRQSVFNSKPKFAKAMKRVIDDVDARILIVSFNNEGFLTRAEIEEVMSSRGRVVVIENEYKRYVGAQIGIYNPSGERVGEVSHLENKEYLYVVGPEAELRNLGRDVQLATSTVA